MSHFILLPEWHPQSAVLLTWPHSNTDFKDNLPALDKLYTNLVCAITTQSQAKILCFDEAHQRHIEGLLFDHPHPRIKRFSGAGSNPPPSRGRGQDQHFAKEKVALHIIKTNDVWIRDYGVLTTPPATALKFIFNAWGGKYDATLDNTAMQTLWEQQGLPHKHFKSIPFVLEGGSLEVDGHGSLMTTAQCLLSPTRNPGLSQAQIEKKLHEYLGVDRFHWLHQGRLEGDDTDSHVDMLARFCNPTTICYLACEDKRDVHFEPLQQMEQELKTFRDFRGQPYDLVPLPLPKPIFSTSNSKRRLPASYANFLINNAQVIVPVYQDKADDVALKQIETCFPEKQIVPIEALGLIEQYGSIHCATMQIPL